MKLFEKYGRLSVLLVMMSIPYNHPAWASYPVIDNATLSSNQRQLEQAERQVNTLEKVLEQLRVTNESLGQFKGESLKNAVTEFSERIKALQWKSFSPHTEIEKIQKEAGITNQTYHFDSLPLAKKAVTELFYDNAMHTVTEAEKVRQARQVALRESAINAYAMALYNRQKISEYPILAQELSTLINSSNNLVSEVGANTLVLLSTHEQILQLQGLLAVMAQMQASHMLVEDPELRTQEP